MSYTETSKLISDNYGDIKHVNLVWFYKLTTLKG